MTTGKFFRLTADPSAISRWYLGGPIDASGTAVDPRSFTQGVRTTSSAALTIPLRRQGEQIDFNFGDFDMIVTPAELNAELGDLVGETIQRIPVRIGECDGKFEILNVLDLVDCFDEAASQFTRWIDADGRSDKLGEYRMITRLRIDAAAASGHHLFRLRAWPIALIGSKTVKDMLQHRRVSGLKFDPVV